MIMAGADCIGIKLNQRLHCEGIVSTPDARAIQAPEAVISSTVVIAFCAFVLMIRHPCFCAIENIGDPACDASRGASRTVGIISEPNEYLRSVKFVPDTSANRTA
jgi:hypothetical protein